jgi:antirestriction protein ArdC
VIVFYKQYVRDAKPTDSGTIQELPDGRVVKETWVLRYYNVFNVDQMELPDKVRATLEPPARTVSPFEAAEEIIRNMSRPPALRFGFDHAAYFPATDMIEMPNRNRFESAEAYYDTLFHEEIHATGHASRLGRTGIAEGVAAFGSETYSREELVAELGAAFLCGTAGIEQATLRNSAAYIRNWSEKLRADSRLIVMAASAAQKAADYILGREQA